MCMNLSRGIDLSVQIANFIGKSIYQISSKDINLISPYLQWDYHQKSVLNKPTIELPDRKLPQCIMDFSNPLRDCYWHWISCD